MADYANLIRQAAKKYGVRPELLLAQLKAESGLNPNVRSPAGARGIAQFMPGTAKSWGVNLDDNDPRDDIKGAARMMSTLIRQYKGDEAKALAAYNAGSGAVAKYGGIPPYKETQNYVKKILGEVGKGSNSAISSGSSDNVVTTTKTIPGVDNSMLRRQSALDFLRERGRPGAMLSLAVNIASAQDIPEKTITSTKRIKSAESLGSPGQAGKGSPDVVALGKLAQRMGLHVGENPAFGGVAPVHVKNSNHYTGHAIDVSGDPQKMAAFADLVYRKYGKQLKELFWNGPGARNVKNGQTVGKGFVSGHTDHVHLAK